ncbi:hypothetical protein C8F04DRAFT_1193576 [Mycena alexandri]|uniref:Uncharacterized protein n=1 Tax=Mycena alexandri TaxID=1745969 RepID=A0AAD6S9D9_9AGAR|nr:hypothetical protein C8F04DRAFT_1193576 [Mycena alexandri]
MTPNPCRAMVLYQPVYKPQKESQSEELPALISDQDWLEQMVRKIPVVAYDRPILYLACDQSHVLKKNPRYLMKTWDAVEHVSTERRSAGESSTFSGDLQRGERYANLDYHISRIEGGTLWTVSHDYGCHWVCACACHKVSSCAFPATTILTSDPGPGSKANEMTYRAKELIMKHMQVDATGGDRMGMVVEIHARFRGSKLSGLWRVLDFNELSSKHIDMYGTVRQYAKVGESEARVGEGDVFRRIRGEPGNGTMLRLGIDPKGGLWVWGVPWDMGGTTALGKSAGHGTSHGPAAGGEKIWPVVPPTATPATPLDQKIKRGLSQASGHRLGCRKAVAKPSPRAFCL